MLIVFIMKILMIMITIMIMMMVNTKQLEALEHYLKSLIEIITNQQELMLVLMEEMIIMENIRVKEIDLKIYHPKNILI